MYTPLLMMKVHSALVGLLYVTYESKFSRSPFPQPGPGEASKLRFKLHSMLRFKVTFQVERS
jgi:hypothetical protein